MIRIGIIGPESTGKSTLAHDLAERFNAVCVPEYARYYMENLHGPYTYKDVCIIARRQIEELSSPATMYSDKNTIFYDTDLIITKIWFLKKYGRCPNWVDEAILMYPMDFYLLCYPDLPWEYDPTRENPHIRMELFNLYQAEVERLKIPYIIVKGKEENRTLHVVSHLQSLLLK